MHCPKCGFEQPERADCLRCGVVFAKWRAAGEGAGATRRTIAIDDDLVADGRVGRRELTILAAGLGLAILIHALPFFRFVMSALVTLLHELGHAIVAWILGHPAVPAFDFVYGGGFTPTGSFKLPIALLMAGGMGWAAWRYRDRPRTLAVIGAIFVVWLFFVSAEWRRELALSAAGHAAEFIIAGILFYQALSGVGWRIPEIERPLGAFAAFFVQIHGMAFANKLRKDPDFLAMYREGKGGALMNDLEVVALNLHIHTPLNPGIEGVAGWLLAFSFVPFAAAVGWYLFRSRCHRVVRGLFLEPT